MSARIRRRNRKIALLVRIDATFVNMTGGYLDSMTWPRAQNIIGAAMALARALDRKGLKLRAMDALTASRRARGLS